MSWSRARSAASASGAEDILDGRRPLDVPVTFGEVVPISCRLQRRRGAAAASSRVEGPRAAASRPGSTARSATSGLKSPNVTKHPVLLVLLRPPAGWAPIIERRGRSQARCTRSQPRPLPTVAAPTGGGSSSPPQSPHSARASTSAHHRSSASSTGCPSARLAFITFCVRFLGSRSPGPGHACVRRGEQPRTPGPGPAPSRPAPEWPAISSGLVPPPARVDTPATTVSWALHHRERRPPPAAAPGPAGSRPSSDCTGARWAGRVVLDGVGTAAERVQQRLGLGHGQQRASKHRHPVDPRSGRTWRRPGRRSAAASSPRRRHARPGLSSSRRSWPPSCGGVVTCRPATQASRSSISSRSRTVDVGDRGQPSPAAARGAPRAGGRPPLPPSVRGRRCTSVSDRSSRTSAAVVVTDSATATSCAAHRSAAWERCPYTLPAGGRAAGPPVGRVASRADHYGPR